jgi:hypothetical protein
MPRIDQIKSFSDDEFLAFANGQGSVDKPLPAALESMSDDDFLSYANQDSPAATSPRREALQPPASKAGTLGGVASAAVQGVAESATTELPKLVGESMEFVGSYLPGETVESIGKDLKEWAEAKGKSLYGEPKKREGLERWVYEGSKMLAPSLIPMGVVGAGVRVLTGVGKLVKAGKAAQAAASAAKTAEEATLYATKAKEYFDAANKAAKMANNVASYSTGALFGTAQAQSTRDNAERQAQKLEKEGDFEGARKAREAGQGMAPIVAGAIEAGGEIVGTKYLGKLFRMDEAGVAKRGAKQLVTDFMKTLGIEVGTEMGQQGGEALTEKVSGIRPNADPIAEALDVIGPTAWMTLVTGGASVAANRIRRPDDTIDLMEEEKTKEQPDVTETIRQAIDKAKKEEAKPRPSTAEEAAETFFGKDVVENEKALNSLRRRGLFVPEDQPPVKSAEESAMAFEEEQARRQGEALRAQAPPSRVAVPIGELGVRPQEEQPVAYKEAEHASEVRSDQRSTIREEEGGVEKTQPGQGVILGGKKEPLRSEPGIGGQNLQQPTEAGGETGREGLTPTGGKPTFRQFVEAKGIKWPIKASNPQYETLRKEYDAGGAITPPAAEISPPEPAGEAVAPKTKGFDPDNDRQRQIFVGEILKSDSPEVKAMVKQAEREWPGEDPMPVVESQIDYDLLKAPEKWLGTAVGKEILARKGWGEMEPVVDTLIADYNEETTIGQYDDSDLEYPPTEKEVTQAASEVVGEEHAKGNTVLQAYQAERGEARKEKDALAAEKAKPAEEVSPSKGIARYPGAVVQEPMTSKPEGGKYNDPEKIIARPIKDVGLSYGDKLPPNVYLHGSKRKVGDIDNFSVSSSPGGTLYLTKIWDTAEIFSGADDVEGTHADFIKAVELNPKADIIDLSKASHRKRLASLLYDPKNTEARSIKEFADSLENYDFHELGLSDDPVYGEILYSENIGAIKDTFGNIDVIDDSAIKTYNPKVPPNPSLPQESGGQLVEAPKTEKAKPAEEVISQDKPILTQSYLRDDRIMLSFDDAGRIPSVEELKEIFPHTEIVKYKKGMVSATQGVTNFRIDVFEPGSARLSPKRAKELYERVLGDIGTTFKTDSALEKEMPVEERFGTVVNTAIKRTAGIKTEPTKAGLQAVIPGASEAETFMLTGAPGEVETPAPTGKKQETETIEEVAEAEELKAPAKKVEALQIINYSPTMKIKNLEALSEGSGAKYLLAIKGQGDDLIAKQWKRTAPEKLASNEVLIDMTPEPAEEGKSLDKIGERGVKYDILKNNPEYEDKPRELKIAEKAINEIRELEGSGTVSAAPGEVAGPRKAGGITTHGIGISTHLVEKGRIDIRGRSARSFHEVAVLAEVYRNPQFETLRYVYVKDGKVVAHEGVTSRLPGSASIFVKNPSKEIYEINRRMDRLGADGVYLVHNHPSGDPTPSIQDVNLTRRMGVSLKGRVKGHIVINHKKYVYIPTGNDPSVENQYGQGEDALTSPAIEHRFLGQPLDSPGSAAAWARALYSQDDRSVILYRSAKGVIRAIQEVPVGLVKNKKALTEYIKGRKREFGSVGAIVVSKSAEIDHRSLTDLINSGVIEDSISISGQKYKSAREDSLLTPVREDIKAFKVREGTRETPQGVEMYAPGMVPLIGKVQLIPSGTNYDLLSIKNRRFMYNPKTDEMVLGGSDIDVGTHGDDLKKAEPKGEFRDFIRGWFGTNRKEFKSGIIHFSPALLQQWIDSGDFSLDAIKDTVRHFIANGANEKTKTRNLLVTGESTLGELFPDIFEGEGDERAKRDGTVSQATEGGKFSVRDQHRRGALRPAKLEDVKRFFPGQEVGLDANKNIYVKTRGGKYVTIYRVDHIEANPDVLTVGYGVSNLKPGHVIPGAMGVTPSGEYYIKLHRVFADTWTLAHEGLGHFTEVSGLLNSRDIDVLKNHIKNLYRNGRWEPANRKDVGGPEDRANFIADRLAVKEQKGPIGRIVLRIRAFIDGILESFGVRSPEGILRGIESGKIFERTGREGRIDWERDGIGRSQGNPNPTSPVSTVPGPRQETFQKQSTPSGEKVKPEEEQYAPAVVPQRIGALMDSIAQPGMLQRAWDEFIYQAQDRFHYLNKTQIEAARRDRAELPESQDGYLAELRYHSMAAAKIDDVEKNHVNPLTKLMSENNIDVEQAAEYLHARHAPEANEVLKRRNPDRKDNESLSGMTDDEAYRIVNRIENGPKAEFYKEIARRIDTIVEETRDILVDNGLEKRETVEAWKKTYKFYVPLMREGKGEAMPRRGRGFEVRGGQKIRAGSTREVVNILANVVAQHEATIVRAEKVKVERAFLEFAKTHDGPWKIDVPEKVASFDADGLIQYRANPIGYMLADNVLAVRVDGKDHHITFDKSDLDGMKILSAMKNLDAADMGGITRAVAKISRWLAIVNTSLNPEFIISNFARDIQTAAYNMSDSEADAVRMKAIRQVGSAFKGIRDFQADRMDTEWAGWFNRFRNAGAQTGWMQSYETIRDREKALIKKIEDMKPGKIRSVKRGLTAAYEHISNMNTAVENAVRLSVFKNLIEAGVPESKSARIAKELTVNFNRRGNWGPALNAFYLFYNASIQGSARIIVAGAKSRKVRMLMGATVVFAAALDILNRVIGGDDDDGENRYDKIAPWIKDRNLIVMLPGLKGHLQIPLPWGYNVFHVMGQAAGEVLTKKNNKATKSALRVGGAIVSAFNPVGGESSLLQTITPTILDPYVQWTENKDWSGRKIRPDANPFSPKPDSQKYWSSVRAPSKWITDQLNTLTGGDKVRPGKIDFSPEAIDLTIDTITGGAGKFVANLISTPIKYAKGEDVESYEIPFLRRLYGKAGKQALTQQYYENMDAVRLVDRQLSHYKNDPAKVRGIVKEYNAEVRMISRMKATQKAMKDLKDQREAAEKIKDPEVRKAREKKIEEVTQKIMNGFNRYYNLSKEKEK